MFTTMEFATGWPRAPASPAARVRLYRARFSAQQLQVPVVDGDGRPVARADFGWADRGVVGEFDGLVKYGRLLRPGQSPGEAVVAEKVREDAIRD